MKRLLLILALVLGLATSSEAAFRLYLVPVIGTGTKADPWRPKYFETLDVWSGRPFGREPWMIVAADLVDDSGIAAQADVFAAPVNLDATLTGGQVNTLRARLEAANIPAGWVSTGMTWRAVFRTILGMGTFLGRFVWIHSQATGTAPRLFTGGVSLDTAVGSLPLAVRSSLTATAQSFSIDTSSVTGATTLRQLLKLMADAFQATPYQFKRGAV